MKSLILSGGLGTRLRGIVDDQPKPMAFVGDRTFLEYLILQLKEWGLKDIVLCIGYLGKNIQEYSSEGHKLGVNIYYSYEIEPLGTGGAIKQAESLVEEENFKVILFWL